MSSGRLFIYGYADRLRVGRVAELAKNWNGLGDHITFKGMAFKVVRGRAKEWNDNGVHVYAREVQSDDDRLAIVEAESEVARAESALDLARRKRQATLESIVARSSLLLRVAVASESEGASCLGTPQCHGINPAEHTPACPMHVSRRGAQ